MQRADHADIPQLKDELDWRAVEMLQAIHENDGDATTTEIRETTGMGNNAVGYRREKMTDLGLIDVKKSHGTNHANPPKRHILTDHAERLIRRGLFDKFDAPAPGDFEEAAVQIKRLRERVDGLETQLSELERASRGRDQRFQNQLGKHAEADERTVAEEIDHLKTLVKNLDEKKKDKRW